MYYKYLLTESAGTSRLKTCNDVIKRYLCTIFQHFADCTKKRESGLKLDTSDGTFFLWIGVTLAFFKIFGTL